MDTLFSSQPESYHQLIKRSLILYSAGIKNCLIIACLLSMFVFIPNFFIIFFDYSIWMTSFTLRGQIELILINLLSLFLFISISWHMHCVMERKKEPLLQDFSQGARKMFAVFFASILINIIFFFLTASFLGFRPTINNGQLFINLFFLLEGFIYIYLFTLFSFLIPIIAVENNPIIHAIKKSISLTWNHWWRTFSVQATPWLYYFFTLIILNFLFKYILPTDFYLSFTWGTLLRFIIFIFFVPWIAAVQLVQLNDLELRKKN